MTITNSTLSGNSVRGGNGGSGNDGNGGGGGTGFGGAVFMRNGVLTITNSTLSDNNLGSGNGGALFPGGRDVYIVGDGIAASAVINNSILGQTDDSFTDFAGAVIGDGSVSSRGSNDLIRRSPPAVEQPFEGSFSDADPMLDPAGLQDNGGLTKTIALETGSPAIDMGNNDAVPDGVTTDQRGPGFTRFGNGMVDIGAFEVQPPAVPPTVEFAVASQSVDSAAGTFTVTVNLSAVSDTDTTVPFTLSGTAVSGVDYSNLTASPVVIKAGQTSTTITGSLAPDPGPNRTLIFTLGTPTGATTGEPPSDDLTIAEPPAEVHDPLLVFQTATITSLATTTGISAGTAVGFENSTFTVVVNGSGFAEGATVMFGDTAITPDSVTPTQVTFTVPAAVSLAADEGVQNVTVVNPGHPPSNALPFTILEELLPDGTRGTADQRFLSEVYRDLLHRQIDQTGLDGWSSLLSAGVSRTQIVLDIENDPGHEFLRVEVNDAFLQYLHRDADASGLASFTSFLAGGATVEQMDALIVSMPEYQTYHAGATYQGFLTAFYHDSLNRAPTSTNPGVSTPLSPFQVATSVFELPEFQQDLAAGYYQRFLDRVFSPGDSVRAGTADGVEMAEIIGDPAGEFYNKTAP